MIIFYNLKEYNRLDLCIYNIVNDDNKPPHLKLANLD